MQETYLTMILSNISMIATKSPGDIEAWRNIEYYANKVTIHLEGKSED